MKEKKNLSKNIPGSEVLIDQLVALQKKMKGLPELSTIEKALLNNEIAIGHLYYSSKIEGTQLTDKQIDEAVHGKKIAAA